MTVKAQISEADVIRVQPGQATSFTILGDLDTRYQATMRAIEPAPESESSDSTSTTTSSTTASAIYYNGLFDVPNPDHKLRVSMTAQVEITLGESTQVLAIPLSVLGARNADGQYDVLVLDQGQPQHRLVTIGRKDSVNVEIRSGLREGDRVVMGDSMSAAAASDGRRGPPPRG